MKDVKIYVNNLNKKYGETQVLKDINFGVEAGEFVSILGPSGCGKTTILRILIGLEALTSGEVYKDGKCINDFKPSQRGMGIVFQSYALFPNMTVLENVMYPLKVNRTTKVTAQVVAQEILKKIGLEAHEDKMPNELSGGQKQRVAIARTLVLKPDVILLDEALSALDVVNKRIMVEELKKIQLEFGVTMIYITHDQEEAFSISDKIIVMSKGCIEQVGTPEQIFTKPANDYINTFINQYLKEKIHIVDKIMGMRHA